MVEYAFQHHIVIAAGGTGGHIFPGLAIANALESKGFTVSWLGTRTGLEAELVPKANISIDYITVSGLRGKSFLTKLIAPFRLLRAIWQAYRLLHKQKPNAVLGMGGFVSGPVGIACWLHRIPLLIHEQNAVAGATNRILARFATTVMQAFPNTFQKKYKAVVTGNPVRTDIVSLDRHPRTWMADETLHVLVLGGSQGAVAINACVSEMMKQLPDSLVISLWHQVGKKHYATIQGQYNQENSEVRVVPFIDDMAAAYQWADIVISRAGALSVAEISAARLPCILIPYPHAVDKHQHKNAAFLVEKGSAILLDQVELSPKVLQAILQDLVYHTEKANKLVQAAQNMPTVVASELIVSEIETVVSQIKA